MNRVKRALRCIRQRTELLSARETSLAPVSRIYWGNSKAAVSCPCARRFCFIQHLVHIRPAVVAASLVNSASMCILRMDCFAKSLATANSYSAGAPSTDSASLQNASLSTCVKINLSNVLRSAFRTICLSEISSAFFFCGGLLSMELPFLITNSSAITCLQTSPRL